MKQRTKDVLVTIAGASVFAVWVCGLLMLLAGCTPEVDYNDLGLSTEHRAGMYKLTSGGYWFAGSWSDSGIAEFTEDSPGWIGVGQYGPMLEVWGSVLAQTTDGTATGKTEGWSMTKNGARYMVADTLLEFDGECMYVLFASEVYYPLAGYAFNDEIDASGCLDLEMMESALDMEPME